ncbi:MAG: glutamine--fructose-6-phosphate transaminase (isomerizing) [Bacilli bacterium]|nr:glutamine--fructose-6-phosphate transaminase (isomerizing) [Bacilli bacterium]
MCGIIGYVGNRNAREVLINGLKTLEYRGYDSAGIAYRTNNRIEIIKANGKIKNLERKIKKGITSHIGIGHTRWATHGKPSEINAHPHRIGKFTIVHNGIIENYESLKKILQKEKYKFKSDTDSEVICALLDKLYKEKPDILKVLVQVKNLLNGSYALGILCDDKPDSLYAIRKDSPLIVGLGTNENFIASDVPAILKYTDKYMIIGSNEIIEINDKVTVYNDNLDETDKEILTFEGSIIEAEKNGYDHFMLKEIHEEPEVIYNTIHPFLENGINSLTENMPSFKKYKKIAIIGCGSAYHAGVIGKNIIEKYGDIKTSVYIASEYRYQKSFTDKDTLIILISQSGETADTIASLRKVKELGFDTLAIVNVVGSSLAREADKTIYIKAGPEISVATTKAYTCQLAILSLIALTIGYEKKIINEKKAEEIIASFYKLPDELKKVINIDYKKYAKNLYKKNICFYIGRGIDYAICLEGSLKLKEISYITTLAYPAGELKHGTISLIDRGTNVIAVVTDKHISKKTISNIKEVKSRGAYVTLLITDNLNEETSFADEIIKIPFINDFVEPIITSIPLQLIGYETAKLKGCDIDKPKNLAKSVTVE